jgi:hypothetical protein
VKNKISSIASKMTQIERKALFSEQSLDVKSIAP